MHNLLPHLALRCFLSLTLFLPFYAIAADDEPRWYQVEIIVFSQNDPAAKINEHWPSSPGTPDMQNAAEILSPNEIPKPEPVTEEETAPLLQDRPINYVELAPDEALQLTELAEKIAASDDLYLLNHLAWRQSIEQNKIPMPVAVTDTKLEFKLPDPPTTDESEEIINNELPPGDQVTEADVETQKSLDGPSPEELLMQALLAEEKQLQGAESDEIVQDNFTDEVDAPVMGSVLDTIPVTLDGPPENIFYGTITLKWSRFLHLMVDLNYRANEAPVDEKEEDSFTLLGSNDETDETALEGENGPILSSLQQKIYDYRLKDSRRIRTSRIYYFDHPIFGVIAQVSPYEPPPPIEEATVSGETPKPGSKSGALGAQ